jgi:hypothetical protein
MKQGQSKKGSLVESLANVVVGYLIALSSQLIIFHLYGIVLSVRTQAVIGVWFTVISIVRSFTLRRIFNRITVWRACNGVRS